MGSLQCLCERLAAWSQSLNGAQAATGELTIWLEREQ